MSALLHKPAFSLADLEAFDSHSSTRLGRERRFLCPLCGDGKPRDGAHRSLCANTANGAWNCKRCHATGKLSDFWTERPKSNARASSGRDLARIRCAQIFKLSEPQPEKLQQVATDTSADAPDWRDQLRGQRVLDSQGDGLHADGAAESYLRGRGIDLETAKAAGVQFAPKFYGRGAVVFPICDHDGNQTGASGRYFDANATPKTRIAGTKRNGLFSTSGALAAETIIVTEAPIDALSLASVGFPAVALCGTSAPAWIHRACGLKRVAPSFDADEAGDTAAASLAAFLAPYGARCARLRPEGAKDWNEALQRDSNALRAMLTRALCIPREFVPRDFYDAQAARDFAHNEYSSGGITAEQRDALRAYASGAAEAAEANAAAR